MNSNWIRTTVGDYCPFIYGKAIKKADQLNDGIPVYGSNGVYTYAEQPLTPPNTIIIGRKGSVGKVHRSQEPCWVSDTAFYTSTSTLEEAFFVYYLLSSLGLEDMNTDAAVPGLNRNNAHRLEIKIPSTEEERAKLIEPLIRLDEKIALNQQVSQTLEAMAQAIFKSWFIDFDPVKAKMAVLDTGGTEEEANLAAMRVISSKSQDELVVFKAAHPDKYAELYETAKLFPSEMEDSELGEIPKGWLPSFIGDEVNTVGGGTPSTKNPSYWEGGTIHWTTPRDLSGKADKIILDTGRKITEEGLTKISSGLLPVDTVLMSSRAPVGYLALAKVPIAVNQGYIAMKCEKTLTPEFVIQWCTANMEEIKAHAGGTTFAEISRTNFRKIPVIVPNELLISRYTDITASLYSTIEHNIKVSDTLAELRDTLLPRLLSGQIELPIDNEDGLDGAVNE